MNSLPKNIIVYADDDPDDLDLVKEAFSKYSQNVELVTFDDGGSILAYLSSFENTPCLIILDINMPILDGKEVLVRLRKIDQYESTPVVLFSTSCLPTDKIFAGQYNAGVVAKPLAMQQMETITDLFIDHCTEDIRKRIRR